MNPVPVSPHIEAGWAGLYAGMEDIRGLERSVRYALYVLLLNALRYLPRGVSNLVGRELGRAAFWGLRGHRRRSIDNILASFPGTERDWARGVALRSMQGLGGALAEAAGLARLGREELLARSKVMGGHNLEEALGNGAGVVIASAHMGCWEYLPAYLAAVARRVAVVTRPQAGRCETDLLRRERARLGVEEIWPGVGALRKAVRVLKDGGIVVCPFDRETGGRGVWVTLMGRAVSAPTLGLRLALMTRSAILPAHASTSSQGQVLTFERALRVQGADELAGVAKKLALAVEGWVREAPDQWVWLDTRRRAPTEV